MLREEIKLNHVKCLVKIREGKRRGHGERKNKYNKSKTFINTVDIKSNISIITLNINGLNILIKRPRTLEWIKWLRLGLGQEIYEFGASFSTRK